MKKFWWLVMVWALLFAAPSFATVTSTYTPVLASADGVVDDFDFTFKVFSTSEVEVVLVNPVTLATTAQTLGVHYTVTLATATPGGTVHFVTPPADVQVSIRRATPVVQTADIPAGGLFREVQIENALDKNVMILQDQGEKLARALVQNPYVATSEIVFPAPEAGKAIGWGPLGTSLTNVSIVGPAGPPGPPGDGSGDVLGPATNHDAYIPQWNGADSKTLSDGLYVDIAGTLASNSDAIIPTQKAVKTYVDTNFIAAAGATNPANLIVNGDFESWSAGAALAPDGWGYTGAGGSVAKNTSPAVGTYRADIARAGADAYLAQSITAEKGLEYWKGRTVTFSCYVDASVANRARIFINDGISSNEYSAYHTGDSNWQLLSCTMTISASATQVVCGLMVDTGDTTAHFDGAMAVEGSSVFAFSPKPAEEGVLTDYSAASTITGWAAGKTAKIYTKKTGKTVFVYFYITGTSNSTATSFTVPYTSSSAAIGYFGGSLTEWYDNSALKTTSARMTLAPGASVVNVQTNMGLGAWTASGTKSIVGSFSFETD